MNLNGKDFANVVQLVDIMVQRGAVRGDELTAVATIRQRFLEAAQATGELQQLEPEQTEGEKD